MIPGGERGIRINSMQLVYASLYRKYPRKYIYQKIFFLNPSRKTRGTALVPNFKKFKGLTAEVVE